MATTKKKTTKAISKVVAPKPLKLCAECGKELTGQRKKFCGSVCKHAAQAKDRSWARQSEYDPKYAGKLMNEYLHYCRQANEPTMLPSARGVTVINRAKLPTKNGFALFVGMHRNTIEKWAEQHRDMAAALDRLMAEQEEALCNNGLAGRYNPIVTKLMLMNNHNYKEKKEIEGKHQLFAVVKSAYEEADRLQSNPVPRIHDGTPSKQ